MPSAPPGEKLEPIPSRRTDLDWLRIIAFGLLIFYHIGVFYQPWPWRANSQHATTAIVPLLEITAPWRLTLLFLISGVATRFMLDKTTTRAFLVSRATRLLIPLVFAILVIVPPQLYVEVVEKDGYTGTLANFYFAYITGSGGWTVAGKPLITPEWAHMWFVGYLCVFTLAIVSLGPRLKSMSTRIAALISGPWLFLIPMAALTLLSVALDRISSDSHSFLGDWRNVAVFGSAFLFGYAVAKHEPFFAASERHRYLALTLAVIAYLAIQAGHLAGFYEYMSARYLVLYSGLEALQGWAAVIAAFGFARRHLRRDGPVRRYLTDAVFPYFIIHQTAIVLAGHWLTTMNVPAHVEAPALIVITITSCVIGYEIVRRIWLLRPLFGLKLEPSATKKTKETAVRPV
jgi:glucan biosynthesis protein C